MSQTPSVGRIVHYVSYGLLLAAEMETNLPLMERLEKLADTWVSIAALLIQRERDT